MAKKGKIRFTAVMILFAVLAVFFQACSTFPTTGRLKAISVGYDILGLVAGDFSSYEDAMAAAKKTYPSADGVVRVKAKLDDKLISRDGFIGYFAVKFKPGEPVQERKKILGIF